MIFVDYLNTQLKDKYFIGDCNGHDSKGNRVYRILEIFDTREEAQEECDKLNKLAKDFHTYRIHKTGELLVRW